VRDTRIFTSAALALAIAALVVILFVPGSSYTLHAEFVDAGGLVNGGQVDLAGSPVGSISGITLTANGQADVTMSISDTGITPLRVGTRAEVRAVGQAGVDNHFVALTQGPVGAQTLPSGSTLPVTQTSSLVPIDALLDAFGPRQRVDVDALTASINGIYAGSGARTFNQMLARFDPALGALEGFTGSLALDRGALAALVQSGSVAAQALASRSTDLTDSVTSTAHALAAVASQHAALADALTRMPAVLRTARGTLQETGNSLNALQPVLRDVPAAATPLTSFLTHLNAMLPQAGPVVGSLNAQLPGLDRSLRGLAPLEQPLTKMLQTLGPAMTKLFPISEGTRYYGTDLALGTLAALFGTLAGEYNADGHFIKVNFVQSYQTLLTPLSSFLVAHPLLPSLFAERTGLLRRCPGGNQPPAPDGSSPWDLGPKWCTASDDTPASVNTP
jgi:phospholipid/cholesterol/gamma-HCH transport system substrate-binding protein